MMKRFQSKKYLVVGFLILFNLTSCNDWLDVESRVRITEEQAIDEDYTFRGMWANMYGALEVGFRQIGNNAMMANACDEADFNQLFANVQQFNLGSWSPYSNPADVWSTYLGAIRSANKFIEVSDPATNPHLNYADRFIPLVASISKKEIFEFNLEAYRIDAIYFKAYYHFELWKRYGKIPIVDKILTPEEARSLPQKSTLEIINYITGLLDGIVPRFEKLVTMPGSIYTAKWRWGGGYTGRVTLGAVYALKCRALLYAASPLNAPVPGPNGYDTDLCNRAAQTAAIIIKSNNYNTNISYRDLQFQARVQPDPLTVANNNAEIIWDSRVTAGMNQNGVFVSNAALGGQNNYFELWNYPKVGNTVLYDDASVGINSTCPSQNLVDAYETTTGLPVDYTKPNPYNQIKDLRFGQTIISHNDIFNGKTVDASENGLAATGKLNNTTTGYYLKKFVMENLNLKESGLSQHVWYIFRYGEVLLNYAEAAYFAGKTGADYGTIEPLAALNLLRQRKNVTGGVRVNPTDLTLLSPDVIRRERQIELAFEGHRFWDVRRWKIAGDGPATEQKPLMRMRVDASGVYNKEPLESRIFLAPKMYYFPIPATDLINYTGWSNNGW